VVDVVIIGDAAPGQPGEPYEADRETKMLDGFDGPTVEDDIVHRRLGQRAVGLRADPRRVGQAVAIVGVDVRASRIAAIKREVAVLAVAVLAAAILALVMLAAVVARSVRKPLARIIEATNAIAKGELHGADRADALRRVRRGRPPLRRDGHRPRGARVHQEHVRPVRRARGGRAHAGRSLQALRGQRRHAAVMFVDVRKFTTLSEGLAPEEVVDAAQRLPRSA
jgi:hypothetical protein